MKRRSKVERPGHKDRGLQRCSYPVLSVAILGTVGRTVNIECLWTVRRTVTVLMVPENLKIPPVNKECLLEVYVDNIGS
jgi:hypothetical protein